MKTALSIAGFDNSCGAGLQADMKTFESFEVYGLSTMTALTAQNSTGVKYIECIREDIVKMQLKTLFDDIRINAIKIGMLCNKNIAITVFNILKVYKNIPIVLDTVLSASTGQLLTQNDTLEILKNDLFKIATIITPNIPEAEKLLGINIKTIKDMEKAALKFRDIGAKNILIKGGHLDGNATDVLLHKNDFIYFENEKLDVKDTHGTGCVLSSAIAANLAKGKCIVESVSVAKTYITNSIKHSFKIGKGDTTYINHNIRTENA